MAKASRADAPPRNPEHRTVSRVMGILEAVMASEPAGLRLADLPDMLGAPKSTIHGLAKGLVAIGYLREHEGRYFQGPAVTVLALSAKQNPTSYHHGLEELSRAFDETAILATLAGESVINIDKVESRQMIRSSPPLHERRPMWPGSYGKVFLAFMSTRRRDNYLRRRHQDPGERARILEELEVIRATGVAFNRGETVPDLYGVASPIIFGDMDVTLAIGLSGPIDRMAENLDDVGRIVLKVAKSLSSVPSEPSP